MCSLYKHLFGDWPCEIFGSVSILINVNVYLLDAETPCDLPHIIIANKSLLTIYCFAFQSIFVMVK